MHADIDERLTMDLASTQAHLDVLYQYYMQYVGRVLHLCAS